MRTDCSCSLSQRPGERKTKQALEHSQPDEGSFPRSSSKCPILFYYDLRCDIKKPPPRAMLLFMMVPGLGVKHPAAEIRHGEPMIAQDKMGAIGPTGYRIFHYEPQLAPGGRGVAASTFFCHVRNSKTWRQDFPSTF